MTRSPPSSATRVAATANLGVPQLRQAQEKYRLDRVLTLPICRHVLKLRPEPLGERSGACVAITNLP